MADFSDLIDFKPHFRTGVYAGRSSPYILGTGMRHLKMLGKAGRDGTIYTQG
jgi:hypothetical protein